MAYITLLSVLSFFLIAISADVQDMVDKYHIDIHLYPKNNTFYVTCYFVFKNLQTIQEISMYIDRIMNPEISVIKKDTDVNLNSTTFQHNQTTGILTFFFNEIIDPGLYVINITYPRYFDFAFNQVYFDPKHEEEVVWLSYTHFQPIRIQRIIPCWIKPKEDTLWSDMPNFNLSILHFAHYSVLTNMPIREERLDEKALKPDMKRTYFDTTPPMSPYQLSIVVTNFTRTIVDEDDVVSMWCRNRSASSLHFALTIAKNITTYLYLSREWLRCRFSARVKLIVIPKIQNSLTESSPERNDSLVHPGIIIVNEDDITYNKENDSVGRKYNVIRLLGYKITQEYYEWIVNSYWEPSTWLTKSFATFIATHNLNQIWPHLRMIDLFVVQIQHECLDFDVDNGMLSLPDQNGTIPVEVFDNMKASIILRMLQYAFNTEAFWKAIDIFTYDSVLRNKERHLKIFWKAQRDAQGKIKIEPYKYRVKTRDIDQVKTYNIDDFMDFWVKGEGYPVLTIKQYDGAFTSEIQVIVGNSTYRGEISEEKRPIPVTFTTHSYIDFQQTRPIFWITPPYKVSGYQFYLNYTEDSWIIFNIQQTGYYRVNYDDKNWRRITRFLNTYAYKEIHVLNRAQLIDDAFHFMLLDKLRAFTFWELTRYLERETDYIAWYPMFKAIEYMSTSFQFYSELYSIWTNFIMMLDNLLLNIEYVEQPTDDDFTKALRQEAAQWACSLKRASCIEMATNLLKQHLKIYTKLSPWWKKWTYCYGLIKADNITWHQTLNKIKGNNNDKLLYLITCPNYLENISNYINTSTTYTNDGIKSHITPSTMVQFKLRHFVHTIAESVRKDEDHIYLHGYKDENFKNLLDNFIDIKPRQLILSKALLIVLNNIYLKEHFHDVQNVIFEFEGKWSTPEYRAFYISSKILESQIREKLEARKNQLEIQSRFFARIKPRYF